MLNCSLDHKKLGERTGEKSLFVVLSSELHKYVLLVAVEVVLPGVKGSLWPGRKNKNDKDKDENKSVKRGRATSVFAVPPGDGGCCSTLFLIEAGRW